MLPKQPFNPVTNFLFIILLLHSFAFSYEQVCDPQDESSLLAFYANLSTSTPLNWSSSTSCCQWEGVDCDTDGSVIGLRLYSRGLKGVISATLGDLVSLTHLNLSNNDLYGPLSDQIFGLINLRVMDLSSNSISGVIPPSIGNLLYLERLNLRNNNLSGPILPTLMKCTNLTEILLSFNHLDGNITELDLSKLVHLRKLDLLSNAFSGTIPESIYSCKSLVAIRVSLNNLTGQLSPKILDLKSLSYLSLSGNSFTNIATTLTILAKCNNLTYLFLKTNFNGESLPSDSNFLGSLAFPRLEYFYLYGCNLTGSFPEWLSNIKTLRAIYLNKNRLTGKIPDSMGTLPNLFSLSVSINLLSGEIPLKLFQLPALVSKVDPKLSRIYLDLPTFSLLHKQFEQTTTLPAFLNFSNNNFSGRIPSEIGRLQGLQKLRFANNHFSGNIPDSLSNLTNLEVLDLSQNRLTGEIPPSLTSLHFLSDINVSYNDLEGPIPTGAQFDSFQPKDFEGNPRLCGELIHRSCLNTTTTEDESGSRKGHSFLHGLYVGFASGFSGILVIVASYVLFSTYM